MKEMQLFYHLLLMSFPQVQQDEKVYPTPHDRQAIVCQSLL